MSTLKANSYQHVDRASPSITINSDGSVSISSTVTYEDVTSVDAVGIVTARSGLRATAGGLTVTAGISTFLDDVYFIGASANVTWDKSTDDLIFNDNAKAIFGTSSDGLEIYHNGNNSIINDTGTGNLIIAGSVVHIKNGDSSESFAKFTNGGSAELYHNDTLRLATTTSGITISDQLNVAGISTFAGGVGIADSIFHIGDDNTAIRFPGNDTFTVETGGSERVRVNNVGMGVGITPVKALNVVVGSGTTELIRLSQTVDASVQQEFGIGWCSNNNHDHPGAQITSQEYDASDTRRSLVFYTRGTNQDIAPTERLRIAADGKVGIGSDAPSGTLSLLANNPNIRFDDEAGSSSNNGEITLDNTQLRIEVDEDDVVDSSQIKFRVDGGDRMNINSDGQVAINASSGNAPTHWDSSTRLSVNGRINSVGSASTASMNTGNGTVVNIGALTNHKLQFIVNNSTKLTINEEGNSKFTGIVTTTTGQFVTPNETGSLATRNRIINGAMEVHQRGSAEVTVNSSTKVYLLDRWVARSESGDAFLMDVDDSSYPPGFKRSLKINCSTASSGGANEIHTVTQNIEGNMIADFGLGNSYARDIAVSFWVKSSLTGDFGFSLQNSAQNRSYNVVYNIASADTWQYISKVIPGPTTGSWNINEMIGLRINFDLGCGSNFRGNSNTWTTADDRGPSGAVSMMQTQNSVWRISGVQIEMGPAATPFEYRGYAEEFYRCQRYYQRINGHGGSSFTPCIPGLYNTLTEIVFYHRFAQEMRSAPTPDYSTLSSFDLEPFDEVPNNLSTRHAKADGVSMQSTGNASRTKGFATFLTLDTAGGYIEFDAEID